MDIIAVCAYFILRPPLLTGARTGAAAKGIKSQPLYPTVAFGRGRGGHIVTNFGNRPFAFDFDEHWNCGHPSAYAGGGRIQRNRRSQ